MKNSWTLHIVSFIITKKVKKKNPLALLPYLKLQSQKE